MKLGIVGLPNAGKSTLFNLVTGGGARTDLYPFTTVESNIGTVDVPDDRLEPVAQVLRSAVSIPAAMRVVDIAGLVRGASKGEGLGNRFLGYIREVDAVAHVVRAFHRQDVSHSEGELDPLRDLDLVETELILADLDTVEKRIDSVANAAKSGDAALAAQVQILTGLRQRLSGGEYLAVTCLTEDERASARDLHLLTTRPVLYVVNVDEDEYERYLSGGSNLVDPVRARAGARSMQVVVSPLGFEEELLGLEEQERAEFLEDLGFDPVGRQRFLQASYELLGLITFFTGNARETRARSLPRGRTAVDAAGKVHTDMARGFIRAEVIGADELVRAGSRSSAREQGVLRVEGRDYEVRDGDVIEVLFNV